MRTRLHRALRTVGFLSVLGVALVVFCAMGIVYRIRIANEWQQYAQLPAATIPGRGDSVVVFAPHCDDETLGCGGMLLSASRNGARIRVVLVTNGDGFRIGVATTFKTVRVTPTKCVEYAYRRQKETLAALRKLGVKDSQVTFLGYPDRGIARLWDTNWEETNPYVSHSTKWSRSPYRNSLTPNAVYCGKSLIRDVQTVLLQARPSHIYTPHPLDNHPDHYATYCFVVTALKQLQSEGVSFARKARVHTYLVHRGDWPTPKGDHPDESLAPPFGLSNGDTRWTSLRLSPKSRQAKRSAILQYRTQTSIEKGFLLSFDRLTEIFGHLPKRKVTVVADGGITVDGDPTDWSHIAPTIIDPTGDYVVASLSKGGDVRAIYLCRDSNTLYMRVDCAEKLSKRIVYTINLRGLDNRGNPANYSFTIRPPSNCAPSGTRWSYRNNLIELALPVKPFAFVQVTTKAMKLTVDQTGWREIELGNLRSHYERSRDAAR